MSISIYYKPHNKTRKHDFFCIPSWNSQHWSEVGEIRSRLFWPVKLSTSDSASSRDAVYLAPNRDFSRLSNTFSQLIHTELAWRLFLGQHPSTATFKSSKQLDTLASRLLGVLGSSCVLISFFLSFEGNDQNWMLNQQSSLQCSTSVGA